ncbi:DUF4244 domain-containing protein [Kitasatospora sp. NPDC004240]
MTAVLVPKAPAGAPQPHLLTICRRRGRWAAGRIRRAAHRRRGSDAGMTTAEYAVGTVAACALAAVLYKLVTGDAITGALGEVIERAIRAA